MWEWRIGRYFSWCGPMDPTILVIYRASAEGHSIACSEGFSHQASLLVTTRRCMPSRNCSMPSVPGFQDWRTQLGTLNIIGLFIHLLSPRDFSFCAQARTYLYRRDPFTLQKKAELRRDQQGGHCGHLIRAYMFKPIDLKYSLLFI